MSITDILIIFGIPSAITTGLFFLLRKYFELKIDLASKKSFADYQQKLDLASENTKLDFQRKIQDFSLYNSKKHEKYIEFHQLLLEAESNVHTLYGYRTILTFEEYNKIDIKEKMLKERFPKGKIDEILQELQLNNREVAISKLTKFLRLIEFQKAEASVINAQNFYWISKLYFSDIIDELTIKLINQLHEQFGIYQLFKDLPAEATSERTDYNKQARKLRKENRKLLDEIINQMKNELAVGYYDNKTTKRNN